MISYEQALQQLLAAASALPSEEVPVTQAAGRILAADVVSPQALPPFDNSAMDGFALCAQGQMIGAGSTFEVVGWQAAGDQAAEAGLGAWEIMTGARMPGGLDSVVPVEQVEVLDVQAGRPQRVRLRQAVKPGQHVRLRGQDVDQDETVLTAGTTLDLNALTLLHAVGVATVRVRQTPAVAVITTGKELVADAGQALHSGQIRDSNRPYLVGRMQAAGANVVWQGMVGDDVAAFDATLDAALAAGARVLVSTGAVSQGRYDFIPDALRARGAEIIFHKVAIRPGKPLLFARLADGALYFGLPGNPISAAVGQRFFVEPVLRRLLAMNDELPLQLPLQAAMRKPPGLRMHARARIELDAQGQLSACVLAGQESFRLKTTLQANAWVVVDDAREQADAGECVQVYGWGHRDPLRVATQELT
ncbi:gephyrin-like molybdotransferase Glp [Stenotrophomonas sp. SY1]|uniref:molybdopterin molybdotransferase MoeA n=1 Tax=Stenotrophomonas sp. SY1 TaxID=477235 RepID=UPI001E36D44C|nr:gephyrin-like molybdotransferase Glp [Stenotrophomonas sp. SY1]MCD9086967.1 molybdopterin molybdotransferase MoeA [Stenotrophomonas sp. SY1]